MPLTPQETLAKARHFCAKAAAIRDLLADPGDGCEDFKFYGPDLSNWYDNLASELEKLS